MTSELHFGSAAADEELRAAFDLGLRQGRAEGEEAAHERTFAGLVVCLLIVGVIGLAVGVAVGAWWAAP